MSAIRELHYSPAVPPASAERATPAAKPPATTADAPSPFARLVQGFSREADRGEATMRGVMNPSHSGVPIDSMHLLALQAGIYRYGETMDLAARLVDKASSAVKTVVQGQ